jgi:hypothetical protein
MSKKSRANGGGGSFVKLDDWLMKTAAWASLDPIARCIWIEITRLYNGKNNGEIAMSCRHAADRVGCDKNIAGNRINVLVERGFIREIRPAGIGWKNGKRERFAPCYALTHLAVGTALPTKDFVRWTAADGIAPATLRVPPSTRPNPKEHPLN